jgi:hypothetical protein
MKALRLLSEHPTTDVKICTPVTKFNITDIRNIAELVTSWAATTCNRVFYNVFQIFPRSMVTRDWGSLLVSDSDFQRLRTSLRDPRGVRVNFLSRKTLDRLYVLIFPDGSLRVPSGRRYDFLAKALDIENLEEALVRSDFAARKHIRHSKGWQKTTVPKI